MNTKPFQTIIILMFVVFAAACVRGQNSRTNSASRIYRDRVEPHWFADATGETNQFWYRVNLPDNGREFIVVNAATGKREPAFDQKRVAAALSQILVKTVDAEHLPVENLDFSRDGKTITLSGLDASWKLDLQNYSLTPASENFEGNRLRATRFVHASSNTGGETEIKFVNRLTEDADLFWIDPDGKHVAYGSLPPGGNRTLHTYAGHVWLAATRAGTVLAVFQAEDTAGLAVIDRQGFGGRRRGEGNDNGVRPPPTGISPDGKWEAIVNGNNLFLRELSTGAETQLTYDANPNSTYARDEEFERNVNMQFDTQDAPTPTPEVYWSPDSKRVVAMRSQPGTERKVYEVESSPHDQLQPKLTSYPYLKAGDEVPVSKPHLFDVTAKKEIPVD